MLQWTLRACSLSVVVFVTLWNIAYQAPLSMGLFRQEYWSGLPFSSSRGSFWPRDWAHVCFISCIAGGFSTHWATGRNVYILLKYGFLWPRSSVVESYLFLVFLRNYQRATTVLKCLVAYVVVVQSLSCVLFPLHWNVLKIMSIESTISSNHLIFYSLLTFLPSYWHMVTYKFQIS